MGKHTPQKHDEDFAPLDSQRAQELESIINRASGGTVATVVAPDKGIVEARELKLISPNESTNAVARFYRHFARLRVP